jgi:hypothetical protein
MDHDWQFGERFDQRGREPGTHIEREASPSQFAEPMRELAGKPIADAAKLGMPLILVEDLADAGIGELGPPHDGADEIVLRGLFEQPACLFHAGAARDHDRAIEPISFENGKQQGRQVFRGKVLV